RATDGPEREEAATRLHIWPHFQAVLAVSSRSKRQSRNREEGMTREPVLFRVDGTRAGGWEALARCVAFAYALQRRRRPCHFLSQLQPTAPLVAAIKRHSNEWIEADAPAGAADDLEEITQEIRRIRPAAVIIDSPNCGPDYLAELVALGPLVVALDTSAPF